MTTKTGYTEGIGRRKTAAARVRLISASKRSVTVNERVFEDYFPTKELQKAVLAPMQSLDEEYTVTALVKGGGVAAQAEAVRLGISRALVAINAEMRAPLKKQGFLKRDPRTKERKKPGLKKARKASQWSKR